MVAYCHGRCYREANNNARLIAAAPDLLAACEAALSVLEPTQHWPWEELVAAIRKAKGE